MKVLSLFLLAIFVLVSSTVALKNEICGLPPMKIGQCRAIKMRFSYVPESNECIKFIYGGCSGNDNNFISKKECEEMCKE